MIKELKNVIEVVDDLKASNLVNVQILKKALTDINVKLEEISEGEELIFVRNALAEFKEALDYKFSNVMENIKELKLSAKDDSVAVENAELVEAKFKSLSGIFDSSMKLLITKVDQIEDNFTKVAASNLEAAKDEFSKISQELKINQQEIIETHKTFDDNTIERFSFVAESIKLLSENMNIQTDIYKDFIEKKTAEIKEFVDANESNLKDDNTIVRAELEGKFKELEETNAVLANDLKLIKESVNEVLTKADSILQGTSQGLSKQFENVLTSAHEILSGVNSLQTYSESINKSLDKVIEFNDEHTYSEILNTLSELEKFDISFVNEFTALKSSLGNVLSELEALPVNTGQAVALELKSVTDIAEDTLAEIKVLQNFSGNILKSVDKIAELTDNNDKNAVLQAIKDLEEANIEFTNDLETIKASIAEVLNRAEELPSATSQNVASELKNVTDVASDTLAEIKILQDYSGTIIKSVNKIVEHTEKNHNEDIFEAIKELDITQNIADLFQKVDVFNNNFNIKTEFLEDQILQMKTMFSDIAIDIQNKEAELLQRESQKVQEYYGKIESVSDSIVNLEESLKLSGVEYKENIAALNHDLNEFIAEFNTIYNELAGSAQLELNNSLNELKQFISVNSSNYNDKLVLIQEQFTQAFKDLYEVLKTNNFELIESGQHAKDVTEAHNKLLESISAKIDIIAGNDLAEEILSTSEETQELVQILNAKVDSLLNIDFNTVPDKQMLLNKKFLEYFQNLSDKAAHLTQLAELPADNTEILELNQKIINLINEIDTKLDIIASIDYEEDFEEIFSKLAVLENKVGTLNFKDDFDNVLDKVSANKNLIDELDKKVETLNFQADFDNVLDKVSTNKNLIEELHTKLDVFVSTSDNDLLEDELQEIKDIILEQKEILKHSANEDNSVVSANIEKVLNKIDGISETINEHDENSVKIKEDLVNTIVSVFSSANFVEETEDIKDFVEEKTDELSKQLIDVKSQIETIKQNDVAEYSYTLADVENDIAKLRQAMNEISTSTTAPSQEFNQISRNIHNLTSSIDAISKNLKPAEIYQLKHNILKLNDDILSISSRTNKLLLNSDESQKTISEGLLAFSHIAFNLEERMNELSNKEFNAEMATKLEKIMALMENAASMDATFHKVLMFLGEWVDAASETFESINDKADEINEISEALSELRKAVPEKLALVDLLEERFEEQQSRMDRLEAKIDELTEMTKLNSNLSIVQKVDKMERMLQTLGANIEKLTSYVD